MQVYLEYFSLPSEDTEFSFFTSQRAQMTCYTTRYPFGLFKGRVPALSFSPVTILYGGNGSGKTTILNAIAQKLKLARNAPFNHSAFFDQFVEYCTAAFAEDECGDTIAPPSGSRFIASDDVFQMILKRRRKNEGIDREREMEIKDYWQKKNGSCRMNSLDDLPLFSDYCDAHRKTPSRFVAKRGKANVKTRSNGESAFQYFTETIGTDCLYLLDEPENSLAPARQIELVRFLEQSVLCNDQFIIATHSPFLLSIRGARIYDLDSDPVVSREWQELENARIYYEFFKSKAPLFEASLK